MSSLEKSENADIKYFAAIPWCARLLTDPGNTVWLPAARRPNRRPDDDGLFLDTLNNENAVPALITFYQDPQNPQKQQQKQQQEDGKLSPPQPPIAIVDDLKALVALGTEISGFPGVAHGGVVAAIMDEVLGAIVTLNIERRAVRGPFMTAYLNTTFVRPIRLPAVVLVVVKIVEWDERKIRLVGSMRMRDENDGDDGGEELARADGMFVKVKKGKL